MSETNKRIAELEVDNRRLLSLKCGVGNALGVPLQEKPFPQAIHELRAEVERLKEALEVRDADCAKSIASYETAYREKAAAKDALLREAMEMGNKDELEMSTLAVKIWKHLEGK